MMDPSADVLPDNTKLALERTFLAYERTLMAWTRTSVSLLTFGFSIYKFFQYMIEREPEKYVDHFFGPRTIGLLMIGIGTFMLLLSSVIHRNKLKELRIMYPGVKFSQALLLAALISILGIVMIIVALLKH